MLNFRQKKTSRHNSLMKYIFIHKKYIHVLYIYSTDGPHDYKISTSLIPWKCRTPVYCATRINILDNSKKYLHSIILNRWSNSSLGTTMCLVLLLYNHSLKNLIYVKINYTILRKSDFLKYQVFRFFGITCFMYICLYRSFIHLIKIQY